MMDNSLKRKTINGFFWKFGERTASQLVSFVISIILARLLLPQEYGVIALSMVFINITSVLAVSGLGTALIQKKDADNLDFSTMFYAGLAISLVLYALLFVTAPYVADLYDNDVVCPVLRALGLTIPISAVNSIQQASVSRQMEFKNFFYATSIGTIVSGVVGVALAYSGFGVWALVGQQLANCSVNTITLNRIIKWRPALAFSYKRFNGMIFFGGNLMLANLIGTVSNELRAFIVGAKYTPADLAFYNRGDSLPAMISNNINSTISSVLFPAISQLQNDKSEVKRAIRRSMMTSSFVMFPLLFLMAVTADKIILILLTERWMPCVPFMRVFCLGHCLSVLGMANLQAINAIGRSDVTFKLEFIKKPLYIIAIFSAMFINPLAIAVANTIYGFIALALNAWPNKKLIDYTLTEQLTDVCPQLLISIAVAGLVYLIGLMQINIFVLLGIQLFVGIGVYCLITRIFSLEGYNYIISTIKNFKK